MIAVTTEMTIVVVAMLTGIASIIGIAGIIDRREDQKIAACASSYRD
jgi:nitrate reductase gamma subunit